MNESALDPKCAVCPFQKKNRTCSIPGGKHPENCPTELEKELCDQAIRELDPVDLDFFIASVKGSGKIIPRIVEIINFAQEMGYTKLGIAFCSSLKKETKLVHDILSVNGFEVVSAICKVGRETITEFPQPGGHCLEQKGVLCNPVAQAKLLNEAGTEFNIVVGLCVGHDSLFFKYSASMSTVLIAKDRMLGHNPAAALYTADSFYSFLKKPLDK